MPKNYLQVAPVSGKWYVSERVRSDPSRWQVVSSTPQQPSRSPSAMILAGPFDTRDQAKNWNTLASASGYVWEKS
jgi:hypothetical protein